jgi:hypothetical protein
MENREMKGSYRYRVDPSTVLTFSFHSFPLLTGALWFPPVAVSLCPGLADGSFLPSNEAVGELRPPAGVRESRNVSSGSDHPSKSALLVGPVLRLDERVYYGKGPFRLSEVLPTT